MVLLEAVWDIRRELYEGEEPLFMVLAYVLRLPLGGSLQVRSLYPLRALAGFMRAQGVEHFSEFGMEGWIESFTRCRLDGEYAPHEGLSHSSGLAVLDLRGLEPHEPLRLLLDGMAELLPGGTLTVLSERHPRYLFGLLSLLGLQCQVVPDIGNATSLIFEIKRSEEAGISHP